MNKFLLQAIFHTNLKEEEEEKEAIPEAQLVEEEQSTTSTKFQRSTMGLLDLYTLAPNNSGPALLGLLEWTLVLGQLSLSEAQL